MEILHKSCSGAPPHCPAQPRITAREASITIGITERATRGIINELEADGYVTKKREGRRIRYRLNLNLPLRAEMQQDKGEGNVDRQGIIP